MVWGVRCGSGTSGTQTRAPFWDVFQAAEPSGCRFKGSSPVQTPGYEHPIPWALVTARRGLTCIQAPSIKVNKYRQTLPVGLRWKYPNREMHLPWERKVIFTQRHCRPLPNPPYGKAGPKAARALQVQPSPESAWVEFWAAHRASPQENPTGPGQRRRGRFGSCFPVLFIVQRQHRTLAPCNHHLHPEHFFSWFPLSPIGIALYPVQRGPLNLSWTIPQPKRNLDFL